MNKPLVICLTPVRNESWILDKFLQATSLWADHIIIADQMSTDGSRDIAKKYPKVILIDNPSDSFNEPERQRILINEARKLGERNLLITLDADEIFTPNIFISPEWATVVTSKPGTIIEFQWANLLPDLQTMWLGIFSPLGYMDDGFEHDSTKKIHSTRIPLPTEYKFLKLSQIKVMHFQYLSWQRMRSKHRWYQCFERVNYPEKSPLDIFRIYHHMDTVHGEQIDPIPVEWIQDYNRIGIDVTSVYIEKYHWWDEKVLEYLGRYGTEYFKKIHIWDIDWIKAAKFYNIENQEAYRDPRSRLDKIVQKWLVKTQRIYQNRLFRFMDNLIKMCLKY